MIFTKFALIIYMVEQRKILSHLKSLLVNNFSSEVKDVILFGSRVSGNSRSDSDYDLLIILKEKPDWKTRKKISELCYDIDLKFDIITDPHILGEAELSSLRGSQPIFRKALSNGIYA